MLGLGLGSALFRNYQNECGTTDIKENRLSIMNRNALTCNTTITPIRALRSTSRKTMPFLLSRKDFSDLIHVPDYKDHPKVKKFDQEYLSKWNKSQFEDLYPGIHFCVSQKKKKNSQK